MAVDEGLARDEEVGRGDAGLHGALRRLRRGPCAPPDRAAQVGRPSAGRPDVAQPSTLVTASRVTETISSASVRLRQSGGAKPRMSPCGMARAITPRSSM